MILERQAQYYFESGRYSDAAQCYAKTDGSVSFEDIALRFLAIRNQSALKTFLLEKLKAFKQSDRIQSTLLCFWILEMYLFDLSQKRALASSKNRETEVEECDMLEKEFRQFLSKYHSRMDSDTVYHMIGTYGNVDDKLCFAEFTGDMETVISHWIEQKNFKKSTQALMSQV